MLHFLKRREFHLIGIFLLVLITYANSLPNGFAYDENVLLLGNKAVHGISLKNIGAVFASLPNGLEYLPVRDLTYMADYALWGLKPQGYHLSNVLYYLFLCLALYGYLSMLLPGYAEERGETAFIISALFAVHPVHTEAVSGISMRKDLVMGFFFFLTLLCYLKYLRGGKKGFFALSVFFSLLSMLSKTTAAVIPAAVFLTDFFFIREPPEGFPKKIMRCIPYIIVIAGVISLNVIITRDAEFYAPSHPTGWFSVARNISSAFQSPAYFLEKAGLGTRAFFLYLKILIIPYPLSIWHPVSASIEAGSASFLISGMGILAFASALLWLRKTLPLISFSMAWYFIAILPGLGLVSENYLLAERYLLLPSLGYCAAFGYALFKGYNSPRKIVARVSTAFFLLMTGLFIALSVSRNSAWENGATLYMDAWRHRPDSIVLTAMTGREYFNRSDYDKAFNFFALAKTMTPVAPDYEFYTALFYYRNGDYDSALKMLDKISTAYGPYILDVNVLYGIIYGQRGDTEKARESYKRALKSHLNAFAPYYSKKYATGALEKIGH
jgi:hypothetical protein